MDDQSSRFLQRPSKKHGDLVREPHKDYRFRPVAANIEYDAVQYAHTDMDSIWSRTSIRGRLAAEHERGMEEMR